MGVYIKGMKKPKECTACPSGLSVCIGCDAFFTGNRPRGRVREDCPIVEVTEPHGRLIDVTKIPYLECADPEVAELVGEALTVIEAEGDE